MRQTRGGQAALDRILKLAKIAMPELKQITVKNVGGYVIPQFLVSSKRKGADHYLDPIQVSDGTLRLVGMLLHLYQFPSPSFLALEEPEQTIHPGLLNVLVDAINEVSQAVQIVVTTHSPYVLDLFPVESIRVATRDDDETSIAKVKHSQIKTIQDGLMTVSEIMALDGLRPEK
jgi:predicted ATPase